MEFHLDDPGYVGVNLLLRLTLQSTWCHKGGWGEGADWKKLIYKIASWHLKSRPNAAGDGCVSVHRWSLYACTHETCMIFRSFLYTMTVTIYVFLCTVGNFHHFTKLFISTYFRFQSCHIITHYRSYKSEHICAIDCMSDALNAPWYPTLRIQISVWMIAVLPEASSTLSTYMIMCVVAAVGNNTLFIDYHLYIVPCFYARDYVYLLLVRLTTAGVENWFIFNWVYSRCGTKTAPRQ